METATSNSDKISVEVTSENFSRRKDVEDAIHTLKIPCSLVYSFVSKKSAVSSGAGAGYVSLLESAMKTVSFKLKESSIEGLEERLRVKMNKLCNKVRKLKGRAKTQALDDYVLFDLFAHEIVSASELFQQVESLENEVKGLNSSIQQDEQQIQQLTAEVERQNALLQTPHSITNSGKSYDEVQQRQKQRKVKAIKTAAERALFFIESFGLNVEKLVLKTLRNEEVAINFSPSVAGSSTEDEGNSCNTAVPETLYLLEKFGVSDECYHELTMLHPQLPRSYKVKSARRDLSSSVELLPLPSPFSGAYRPLKSCIEVILEDELAGKELLSSVLIKFSGDGASFSRNTSYVLISFSFPSLCEDVLSGTGNHTVAAVKISEDYDSLRDALKPVLDDINDLIKEAVITINGRQVELEVVHGSDCKFMHIVMGLNASNARFACLWCPIDKKDRWDMSVPSEAYNGSNMRTLDGMKECVAKKKLEERKGCVRQPLIEIEPASCIPDELHLFLRITDVVFHTFFGHLIALDHQARVHQSRGSGCLQNAVKIVRGFGISFNVWKCDEKQTRSKSPFEITNLNRDERLKVLLRLPEHFDKLLPETLSAPLAKLWKDFHSVYMAISCDGPNADNVESFAKAWVTDFVSFSNEMEGHQKSCVTPYMHIMAYHVPDVIRRYGNIRKFSGQGVEKNNDDAKRHYYSGNRHNAAEDILITEARLETLERDVPSCVREKRKYVKQQVDYWEKDIFDLRKRHRPDESDDTMV